MEKYVTRYTIEYFPCKADDEDRATDYIYADSYEEAMAAFEHKHGKDCVVTMCEPIEVPARYREYDAEGAPSLLERMKAARQAFEENGGEQHETPFDRRVDDFEKF